MTKYILHGGNTGESNRFNNDFFKEMTAGLNGKINILLNYFSRGKEEFQKLAEQDKKRLLKYSKNKNLEFQVADPQKFEKQLKWADVMYMRGGETYKLMNKLKHFKNIEKLLKGKVIAGSSAGAYAVSKYYYGISDKKRRRQLGKGLGILNIKCYCHAKPNDTKIIQSLMNYKEELPLVLLPNYKMQIIHK